MKLTVTKRDNSTVIFVCHNYEKDGDYLLLKNKSPKNYRVVGFINLRETFNVDIEL